MAVPCQDALQVPAVAKGFHGYLGPSMRPIGWKEYHMKKAEIVMDHIYIAKVAGKLAPVRIVAAHPAGGWVGRNERTGREVRIRSAARSRHPKSPSTRSCVCNARRLQAVRLLTEGL